ncbi:MAG: hypothetical protein Fur0035_06130 [Anaerolineales bacterium]
MRHSREEVIKRTIREFNLLNDLVSGLVDDDWNRLLTRPETRDPWTVKDALAHITHFKADVIRKLKKQPIPAAVKGLSETDENHLIYARWRDRSPQDILAWHRQVQDDILTALQSAPEEWFSGREHRPEWPFDLESHSRYHRIQDIEQTLKKPTHSGSF